MGNFKPKSQLVIWGIILFLGGYFIVRAFFVYEMSDIMFGEVHILSHVKNSFQKAIITTHMPSLTFPLSEDTDLKSFDDLLMDKVWEEVPIYQYFKDYMNYETEIESDKTYAAILASEAKSENTVDPETGEVTVAEGAAAVEDTLAPVTPVAETAAPTTETAAPVAEAAAPAVTASLPFALEQLDDFKFLYSTFYTGDSTTSIGADQLNRAALMDKDMKITVDNTAPQILIYHTHASEGYADSVVGDYNTTVVGVGNRLAELLHDTYGYNVIHETGVYDNPRDDAYAKTPPVLESILSQNPSIEVIIDVHRDGISNPDMKLVKDVNGKQTAQFMFVNGLCYSNTIGNFPKLENPYMADNRAFSFQLQLKSTQYYPGLARKIYLKPYRYNMQYRPKSLCLEVGAQTNTLEEAVNAMDPVADILNRVLKGVE